MKAQGVEIEAGPAGRGMWGPGPSWGSTTSEAASQAVILACEQLVATLKPAFAQLGEGATWEAAVRTLHPALGFSASKVGASSPCCHVVPNPRGPGSVTSHDDSLTL